MFNFGKNWKEYSRHLTQAQVKQAEQSMKDLLGVVDLRGKSFLDIGSGSGLFSIAAAELGASPVMGIDVLLDSVECGRMNAEKFAKPDIKFEQISALSPELDALPQFDVVYSWGVLHHTGDMWRAIDNAARRVKKGGMFTLAIYNKHIFAPLWKVEKFIYNRSPRLVQKIILALYILLIAPLKFLVFGLNYFRNDRAMRFYYDAIDWIGGYPYEYASRAEIESFLQQHGFRLTRFCPTMGMAGCNQFVFVKT